MQSAENKRALLILNPNAGRMKSRSALFDIIHLLSKHGYSITVHSTTKKGDAIDFVANGSVDYGAIIVCGGDGTLNEVVTGMMQIPAAIPIGYIPCGTANDLASSLGLSRNVRKSVLTILNGQPFPYDIGRFNQTAYFNYIASFGAFTKVSYATAQPFKNAVGYLAYFFEGLRNVGEIRPYQVKITMDDVTTEGEFLFGAVMNTTRAGGIFKFDHTLVDFGDGKFEVLLIRNPRNASELKDVVKSLAKKQYDNPYVTLRHAKSVTFDSKKSLSWTIDGEFGGQLKHVDIENLHQAIQIICP